jgi:ankyrin repeat protein
MNKTITFLLLIAITTLSHGMEKIICDKHCDEKALKAKIDAWADAHEKSHLQAAKQLMQTHNCCKPIYDKIDRLFDIAHDPDRQFTTEDLSDPWYVNATETGKFTPYPCKMSHYTKSTLLSTAYTENLPYFQLQKIKTLIHAGANVKNITNNNLLIKICLDRADSLSFLKAITEPIAEAECVLTQLLTIAELLLQHGADPDFRISDANDTPLIKAVRHPIDQEYAHLLIWYNADPYKTITYDMVCSFEFGCETTESAFDLDKKGWLKKMVDDKQQTIFKYLLFKNHDFKELTLPQDLINLIRYKIWEVGKNSYKNYPEIKV